VQDVLGVQVADARAALLGHAQLDGGGQQVTQGVHAGGDAGQQHAGDGPAAHRADAAVRTTETAEQGDS
jgi:hypothetical protein